MHENTKNGTKLLLGLINEEFPSHYPQERKNISPILNTVELNICNK